MKIVINNNGESIPATLEVVDGEMIVSPIASPKEEKVDITKFKDGDVVTNIEGVVIIYRGITTYGYCGSFVSLDHYNQLIPHYKSYLTDCIRLATEEEKQKLFDALAKEGKAWDAEKKAVVDLKWKPKEGEKYFAPVFTYGESFHACEYSYQNIICVTNIYSKGWCFKTREECEAFCKRLNEVIKEVKP